MEYLLDTSVLIELIRQKEIAWSFIGSHKKDVFFTSNICVAEIFEGIYREKNENISRKKEFFEILLKSFEVLDFDKEQAEIAGRVRAKLSSTGKLIGDLDILIAASAISLGAILLTYNPKHFKRIDNLQVVAL